jgi:hypothetical protein
VTLPQQSAAFCQKKAESPKKAAIAIVFGLPCDGVKDVNLTLMACRPIAAGFWCARAMGELYRLKVDRTEKGQRQ